MPVAHTFAAAKKSVATSKSKKKSAKKTAKRTTKSKSVPAKPKAAAVHPKSATQFVTQSVVDARTIPVENPGGLVPFFEQLYLRQKGEMVGPARILQYGDSHTAADEFSGELRSLLQGSFGNGGSGFSMAGRPWKTYRRRDVRTGSTDGWHTGGLVTRNAGDGIDGLGGISMTATHARESVFLEADAAAFELFYYQQPGGGAVQLYDNGLPMDVISTDGEAGPRYYRAAAIPGPHRFELETVASNPVRLFGWVAENPTGVTYEALGINGAQATIVDRWNQEVLDSNMGHRNPDLIVLSYGTNEAGMKDLSTYREKFKEVLARFREASPTAAILVVGPPDRAVKIRKKWTAMPQIGTVIDAQRKAARDMGCAFIDLREKMGGSGAMIEWVEAGMAQADHVHFTSPGYHALADVVFDDIMHQYAAYLKARDAVLAEATQPALSTAGSGTTGISAPYLHTIGMDSVAAGHPVTQK